MESGASQYNILNLTDSFIEQMVKIRNTLRVMSISALILAPIAIGLALYLINHPSFFNVLQTQGEFGVILSLLLGSVIGISSVWMIVELDGPFDRFMEQKISIVCFKKERDR